MKTLADFIAPDLELLSIGINPSLHAARAGYPFAFARNRFWPALNASSLIDETLVPGIDATLRLLHHHRIGFTDVVKRATPGAGQLRSRDFAHWVPHCAALIADFRPRLLWFHGKTAVRGFCRHLFTEQPDIVWGEQAFEFMGVRCFVSPNPSPANARFSLADIVASYNALAAARSSS